MSILITIVAVLLIIVGVIMRLFKNFMVDAPLQRKYWDFQDYIYAAIPYVMVAVGIGLLWWF